ncbi:hypothetical protein GQ85_12925 [Rhodococcus rhodochrous]|nr:hypothetical protein GQ85_12925 [Rhodococcus rhodochrous]
MVADAYESGTSAERRGNRWVRSTIRACPTVALRGNVLSPTPGIAAHIPAGCDGVRRILCRPPTPDPRRRSGAPIPAAPAARPLPTRIPIRSPSPR